MKAVKFIYVNDPLCGWCFAIRDAVKAAMNEFGSEIAFEAVFADLFAGANAKVMNEGFRDHLRRGMPAVEAVSTSRFGDHFKSNIVGKDDYVYETGYSSRGILAIRKLATLNEIDLIAEVQEAFFVNGLSANDVSTYLGIAKRHGISSKDYLGAFFNPTMGAELEAEFARGRGLLAAAGTRSLPTLLLASATETVRIDHEAARHPDAFVAHVRVLLGGLK